MPKIAETEGKTVVRIDLGQEPRALRIGGEEFDDGLEVECVVALVHCGALRAAVPKPMTLITDSLAEQLLAFLSLEDPIGPVTNPPDRWGTTGTNQLINEGRSTRRRKRQRTKSVRRVGVAPLTRRCRARAGCSNSPVKRRIFRSQKPPGHEGPHKESNERRSSVREGYPKIRRA